ncbi:MAG: hypothetical protein ACF8TS_01890 [Maioricimonas sp. JB049]
MRYRFSRTLLHPDCRRRLAAALLLMVYVTATVGLPATNDFAAPTSGCRCDDDLQQSGQCCCRNRARAATSGSCCRTMEKSPCCAGRKVAASTAKRPTTPPDTCDNATGSAGTCHPDRSAEKEPSLTVCSCGGEPIRGLVCINDPRLLPHSCRPTPLDGSARVAPPVSERLRAETCAPDTPPPQSLTT